MKKHFFFAAALVALPLQAQSPNALVDQLLDRIVEREKIFLESIQKRTPLIETYIQEIPATAPDDDRPSNDHYFLGRFQIGETIDYQALVGHADAPAQKSGSWLPFRSSAKNEPITFLPRGFAQMAVIDLHNFDRKTYSFEYVRREFLGDVRCLVFDVTPLDPHQAGKFTGRIWVEDQNDSVVRFNGIYRQAPPGKGAPPEHYFHFDSWRVNVAPSEWVPSQIYVEEEGPSALTARGAGALPSSSSATRPGRKQAETPRFKAQTRIWDYAASPANKLDELTSILIDSRSAVKDQSASKDVSPLESQRSWERQAEENLVARLEKGGLLAPSGPVEDVLNTVVNNLIVSANLNVEAHCRVLLTTPLETFSVGHTIVISRGLIDVLPDEASLALVLADELSHIALGHRTQTQFAFNNQTMLSDAELLQKFRFERSPEEMDTAGKKTIEIMSASPYKKTANAGLFLKTLANRGTALPHLLQSNLGNQVANASALDRLADFVAAAPLLEEDKLEQIAALPLGSRVKLNPWSNQIELVKTKPLALLSPREKMPFEVTPFVLYLVRADTVSAEK